MAPLKDQDPLSRVHGLHWAVLGCLDELTDLAISSGEEPRRRIEALRDKIIHKFKQSEIAPELLMHHAEVNRSAIEAIELAFADFIADRFDGH